MSGSRGGHKRPSIQWPSPAMVIAVIALFVALTGTAFAALGKNSVGTKQLKAKAVTTGKIANNSVNATKIVDGSLTGADINVGALGTVPKATEALSAGNASTVGGHGASCPGGTTLIRGLCFDSSPGPLVENVKAAADACAAKGGFLPTPLQLYSVRSVINLGTGVGTDRQLTDSYFDNPERGTEYSTVAVDGRGTMTQVPATEPGHYTCAYALVR